MLVQHKSIYPCHARGWRGVAVDQGNIFYQPCVTRTDRHGRLQSPLRASCPGLKMRFETNAIKQLYDLTVPKGLQAWLAKDYDGGEHEARMKLGARLRLMTDFSAQLSTAKGEAVRQVPTPISANRVRQASSTLSSSASVSSMSRRFWRRSARFSSTFFIRSSSWPDSPGGSL